MAAAQDPVSERGKPPGSILGVFIGTVAVFLLLIAFIFAQEWIPNSNTYFEYIFFPGIAALTILGVVLVILAARAKLGRGLKLALTLTGVAAIGMPASAILHNVVYGLLILWFGQDFWGGSAGGDEGFFFILALIVFPAVLIVSAVISIVLFLRACRSASG